MLASGLSEQHKEVVKDLKDFFILSGNKNVAEDEERPWRSKNMGSPQQYGEIDGEKSGPGKDCALFVILYIARYLANESIDYSQNYIRTNKIREKIFTNLFHKDFTKEKL
jgi:Ulp1 family protease